MPSTSNNHYLNQYPSPTSREPDPGHTSLRVLKSARQRLNQCITNTLTSLNHPSKAVHADRPHPLSSPDLPLQTRALSIEPNINRRNQLRTLPSNTEDHMKPDEYSKGARQLPSTSPSHVYELQQHSKGVSCSHLRRCRAAREYDPGPADWQTRHSACPFSCRRRY